VFSILASAFFAILLSGCGGGSGSNGGSTRSFLMGSTPFFGTPSAYPDWKFENMGERDLLSLHVDDFFGVPWDYCSASGCTNLPANFVSNWQSLVSQAHASGKRIYLAVSPLGDRKTLAGRVLANGTRQEHWLGASVIDANGCYRFADDANAALYKAAYISYLKYLVDLVQPDFLSPAVEMNMPFTTCPAQKTAWIAWYSDVHAAIKAAYPSLVVFGTFQMEYMYGIADASAACAVGVSNNQCFDARLTDALAVPGDRIAFSTYPSPWSYQGGYPTDTYDRVALATSRKIWVSETGWPAVKVRQSYLHGTSGSCGADLLPDTIANDSNQESYLNWLLGQAQAHRFEAVVWWLNRDYLDGTVAQSCPCDPATSDTCMLADIFYQAGELVPGNGPYMEMILRVFGNMALHNYDGSNRPAQTTWSAWAARSHSP
jgi:hypothetical protein